MSQEFDNRVLPRAPHNGARQGIGMCALSVIIKAIGIFMVFVIIISGAIAHDDMMFFYILGGVLNCVFNFALAVIVDACDKYRKAHKG